MFYVDVRVGACYVDRLVFARWMFARVCVPRERLNECMCVKRVLHINNLLMRRAGVLYGCGKWCLRVSMNFYVV